MMAFLKDVVRLLLEILPGVRAWRRRKRKEAFREAVVKGDEARMNKLWQEMEDGK